MCRGCMAKSHVGAEATDLQTQALSVGAVGWSFRSNAVSMVKGVMSGLKPPTYRMGRCGFHATSGKALCRLPVRANSALPTAGAKGGTAGSPTPAGWRVLGTMWVSTVGVWLSESMG
jgi:hypothetical protein